MMEETAYQTWWALHLRVAPEEHLSPEEHATYEAGLKLQHRATILLDSMPHGR